MELADSLGMLNQAIMYAGATMGASDDKDFIRKENQKSRDFQLEMWNKANTYNLPSAVMQRYKDAGLNPNLIYDNGAKAGFADLASAPGHSAPNMNSKDISRYMDLVGGAVAASQLNVNQSIVDKNKADAERALADASKTRHESDVVASSKQSLIDANKRVATLLREQNVISHYQANILQNQSDFSDYWRETEFTVDYNGQSTNIVGWQLDVMKAIEEFQKIGMENRQIEAAISKLGRESDKLLAETRDVYKGIQLKEQTIKVLSSQEYLNYTQANLNNASSYLNYCLAAKYQAETKRISEMLTYDKYESYFKTKLAEQGIKLSKMQEYQIYNDITQAIQNNELDRYLRSVPQRYGSGVGGNVLGFLYETLVVGKEGGAPYAMPNK